MHYAAQLYPARLLGDEQGWARIKAWLTEVGFVEDNEESLIPQWQACIDFDSRERLGGCRVPLHVIAFSHDVQTPPPLGAQVAAAVPEGELHVLDGLGHCSCFGHRPDVVNERIRAIIDRYA